MLKSGDKLKTPSTPGERAAGKVPVLDTPGRVKKAGRRSSNNPPEHESLSVIRRNAWGRMLCVALLLLAGAVFRLLYLGEIPAGLTQDEASTGYEAWAMLHYGITRNGYAWPVHFLSWGSGQGALYSYLSLPFIAAFDLTAFSTRLLMALTGIASLLLFYLIALRSHPAFALLALLLLVFCPWHLMYNRWALESNFLPFVILLSVYFFTRPDNARLGIQSAGVFVLSLSVYAYSAAFVFAPLFLALLFGWLRAQDKLPLRHVLFLSALSLLTVLPMLLFLAVNWFDWEAIRAGISMPRFTGMARYEEKSTLFTGRLLEHLGDQWLYVVQLLSMTVPDGQGYYYPQIAFQDYHKLPNFALFFPLAIVPLAFGFGATLYRAVKQRDYGVHLLMALWFIAALAIIVFAEVAVHRANVMWLPALYFTALGVFYACRRWRVLWPVAVAAYLIYGGWFVHAYFTQYNDHWPHDDLSGAIASLVERTGPNDKIYITWRVHEAYMHTLFQTKTPPQDYLATRIIPEPNVPFQKIASFGRFIFFSERSDEARNWILHHKERAMTVVDNDRCRLEQHGAFVTAQCDTNLPQLKYR